MTEQLGSDHSGTHTFTGTIDGKSYSVELTDPTPTTLDEFFELKALVNQSGVTRSVTALVKGPDKVEALKYALYGNYIHFDNHSHLTGALTLETSVFSNSGILVDKGVTINGSVEAVQYVAANTGPAEGEAGVPDTIFGTSGSPVPALQGDPDPSPTVASAPVQQVIPPPPLKEFPSLDFDELESLTGTGRTISSSDFESLLANARSWAELGGVAPTDGTATALPQSEYPGSLLATDIPVSVKKCDVNGTPACPAKRAVRVPNGPNPDYQVEVGSTLASCPDYPCAADSGADLTYEVIIEGEELAATDSVLYLEGDTKIDVDINTVVRMEGSLIVNGKFDAQSATEFLAWEDRQSPWFVPIQDSLYANEYPAGTPVDGAGYDFATDAFEVADSDRYDIMYSSYPALAANGKIGMKGSKGPVHIEGVVYTVAESHLHRSDPWAPAYSVGSEIADTIHNCQFFSFAYDPAALDVFGFYDRQSGRPYLKIIRLSDE